MLNYTHAEKFLYSATTRKLTCKFQSQTRLRFREQSDFRQSFLVQHNLVHVHGSVEKQVKQYQKT